MRIKKYTANKDNTITNAFTENLTIRGTGSNMGSADVLEVFSIYGQTFSSGSTTGVAQTQELSRVLVEFPVTDIISDRSSGQIPTSGNVDFYLCVYNAKHGETVPRAATYTVVPVSSSWEEGFGLDMENYQDLTNNQEGSNWIKRAGNDNWNTIGGAYLTSSEGNHFGDRRKEITLESGTEDLKINVTDDVERWINPSITTGFPNYGFGIFLTASQEAYFSSSAGAFSNNNSIQNDQGATRSYYTKRFFSRTSEFFHKRPIIEARWDSSTKDNRGNVQYSSSLLDSSDNLNTLYLYNFVNGQLKNVPGVTDASEKLYVQLFSGSSSPTGSALDLVTTSDYTTTTVPTVITGGAYVVNINNLKPSYNNSEIARFRVFTRLKDWSPTIYTKAVAKVENYILDNMYFKINRTIDDEEIIPYGTGSVTPQTNGTNGSYTRLSYDISGSYFDLDMSMLEPGYMYYTQIAYYDNNSYKQFNQTFNFKVNSNGY